MAVRATYRFTTDEYHRLAEAGILDEDDRIELLNGELIIMPPIGTEHSGVVNSALDLLSRERSLWIVSVQNPIVLDDHSEPQPDVVLLRREPQFYKKRKPRPEDILLLIEVADTSLPYDRGEKLSAYARNGLAEVWIVNLGENVLEVYREPRGERYESMITLRRGDSISPALVPEVTLEVGELLL